MSGLSRRSFLHASAAAAAGAAVLASPLSGTAAAQAEGSDSNAAATDEALASSEPMIVHVRDARTGEIAVLHGTSEVVYRDPELVRRVVRAARRES